MNEYQSASAVVLGCLGSDFRTANQFDIRIKDLSNKAGFLIRTMEDRNGILLSYGIKFYDVDRLLSQALARWTHGRQDPFKQLWSCLFWSPLPGYELPTAASRLDPAILSRDVDNFINNHVFELEQSLELAWNNQYIDGISRYEWPAASIIVGRDDLFLKTSRHFLDSLPLHDASKYEEQLEAMWKIKRGDASFAIAGTR